MHSSLCRTNAVDCPAIGRASTSYDHFKLLGFSDKWTIRSQETKIPLSHFEESKLDGEVAAHTFRQPDISPMKQTEYFKRAATDAAFRKAEIQEQRDLISIGKVLFWCLAAPVIFITLYFAFTSKSESSTWQSLFLIMLLMSNSISDRTTTLAALEAMEDPNPSPASEEINVALPQR